MLEGRADFEFFAIYALLRVAADPLALQIFGLAASWHQPRNHLQNQRVVSRRMSTCGERPCPLQPRKPQCHRSVSELFGLPTLWLRVCECLLSRCAINESSVDDLDFEQGLPSCCKPTENHVSVVSLYLLLPRSDPDHAASTCTDDDYVLDVTCSDVAPACV